MSPSTGTCMIGMTMNLTPTQFSGTDRRHTTGKSRGIALRWWWKDIQTICEPSASVLISMFIYYKRKLDRREMVILQNRRIFSLSPYHEKKNRTRETRRTQLLTCENDINFLKHCYLYSLYFCCSK